LTALPFQGSGPPSASHRTPTEAQARDWIDCLAHSVPHRYLPPFAKARELCQVHGALYADNPSGVRAPPYRLGRQAFLRFSLWLKAGSGTCKVRSMKLGDIRQELKDPAKEDA